MNYERFLSYDAYLNCAVLVLLLVAAAASMLTPWDGLTTAFLAGMVVYLLYTLALVLWCMWRLWRSE